MQNKVNNAINLYKQFRLNEAQTAFEALLLESPYLIEALVYLGKIQAKAQNYGAAVNYYKRVLDIDSENMAAKTGIELINNVLSISNNFYFENPYTDDELYDF